MKIVVTGASGFIGKNLLLALPREWKVYAWYNNTVDFPAFIKKNNLSNITPIQCDLSKPTEVKNVLKADSTFDAVVYLAANTNPQYSVQSPLIDLHLNTVALVNFLENIQAEKFVFVSSGAVYAGHIGKVNPQTPLQPILPYSISKLASEQYVKFYTEIRKNLKNYINLRFNGAFGKFEPDRKVFTKMINTFCIEGKNEFEIYGNGNNLIDAMYIDDAVDGFLKVINNTNVKNTTVDFCLGKPQTINELVTRTAAAFGIKNLKIRRGGETFEPIQFTNSPEQMYKLFGFKPKTKIETGIKSFAKSLTEQKNKNSREKKNLLIKRVELSE